MGMGGNGQGSGAGGKPPVNNISSGMPGMGTIGGNMQRPNPQAPQPQGGFNPKGGAGPGPNPMNGMQGMQGMQGMPGMQDMQGMNQMNPYMQEMSHGVQGMGGKGGGGQQQMNPHMQEMIRRYMMKNQQMPQQGGFNPKGGAGPGPNPMRDNMPVPQNMPMPQQGGFNPKGGAMPQGQPMPAPTTTQGTALQSLAAPQSLAAYK
jgi:hypothetical protein